jgi:predicted dehydrogenase
MTGVAVVGRRFGCRVQVPALRAAGFDVVALVGRDLEPTAYKADKLGIPHACPSLTDALALPGVDAVAIATPPHTHFDLALEAVESGRHVLCEKPFTTDAAQAAALVDARDRACVVGALGHEFRWNPARVAVGAAITSGAIGEVRLATVVEYSPFLLHTDDSLSMPGWFEEPGVGGWLGANGSHTLDQLRVWLGPFRSVSAAMLVTAAGERVVEDAYSARFVMGDEGDRVEVVLQNVGAAWSAGGMVSVTGTRGTIGIDDGGAWIADADGRRALPVLAGSAPVGEGRVDDDDLDTLGGYELRHYEQLAAAFLAAVEGRPLHGPVDLPVFDDGLGVMRCMDAMRTSAAAGGALTDIEPVGSA